MALAAGISKSAYQLLDRASGGLLPGGHGIEDFKRVATIGAFMAGGVPLLGAAGMAKAIIMTEFNQEDGEAPTGLNYPARNLAKEYQKDLPIFYNDYWYHRILYRQGIRPGRKSLGSDAIVEIVDRKYVFTKANSGIKLSNSMLGVVEEASLVGWLEEWQRGLEPHLVHITERVRFDHEDKAAIRLFHRLNSEAQSARANAVGKLTINISLAIRRALDRLMEHRNRQTFPNQAAIQAKEFA